MQKDTPQVERQPKPVLVQRPNVDARDRRVRQVLGLSPDTQVTDKMVLQAARLQHRRTVKATQSMDYRTMVAHFSERTKEGRAKQAKLTPAAPAG